MTIIYCTLAPTPLSSYQPHVPFHGHAFEARVYAEDPFRKFLPSTGPLVTYREPAATLPHPSGGGWDGCGVSVRGGGGVRVDAGVVEGSAVSIFYDPMISKLVTYGNTRENALGFLGMALDGESRGYLLPAFVGMCEVDAACFCLFVWRCFVVWLIAKQ